MGWSIGYDDNWRRNIGYGVPAYCDHPGCGAEIDRGLAYVCGGEPYGGEHGCGLHFCEDHLFVSRRCSQRCFRCHTGGAPFKPAPEHPRWLRWKAHHRSWARWRREHLLAVARRHDAVDWCARPRNRKRFWELYAKGKLHAANH